MKNDMKIFYLKLLLFSTVLYLLILAPAFFGGTTNKTAYIFLVVFGWFVNLIYIIYKILNERNETRK